MDNGLNLGKIIKHQRVSVPLTLQQLAAKSGVSPSYLGRIERGDRFPSARVLRKIAQPLGVREDDLFTLAGYRSSHPPGVAEGETDYSSGQLDPYVARVLSQEPIDIQRSVIAILTMLKTVALTITTKREPPASTQN